MAIRRMAIKMFECRIGTDTDNVWNSGLGETHCPSDTRPMDRFQK